MTADHPQQRRKFYGRIKGKKLRPKQQERFDHLLPQLLVRGVDEGSVGLNAMFSNENPVWLEIGFGGGEHLVGLASQNPDVNLIGCEVFLNGVAMALRHIEEAGVSNLRIHPSDARDLIDALPKGAISRIYLLYPDPWPKSRHEKRRFMHPDNLKSLRRIVTEGAELRLASDIPEYIDFALDQIALTGDWLEVSRDRFQPWQGWLRTRYEAKAIREGRKPQYCIFKAGSANF